MKTIKKVLKWTAITFVSLFALGIIIGIFTSDGETAKSTTEEPKQETKEVKKEETKKVEPVEREMNKESFDGKVKEIIEMSGGVIVDIQPNDGDYHRMVVTVSDDWYASPEHEKQRFADAMHEKLLVLTRVNGMIKVKDEMFMDIEDTYGEEVADYSLFSGMKIKK